jgi:hypothetical protein
MVSARPRSGRATSGGGREEGQAARGKGRWVAGRGAGGEGATAPRIQKRSEALEPARPRAAVAVGEAEGRESHTKARRHEASGAGALHSIVGGASCSPVGKPESVNPYDVMLGSQPAGHRSHGPWPDI